MTNPSFEESTVDILGVFVLGLTPVGEVTRDPREMYKHVRIAKYAMDDFYRHVDSPIEIHTAELEVRSTGEFKFDFTYTHVGDNADYLQFRDCCFWTRKDPGRPAWISNPPHWNHKTFVNYMIDNTYGSKKSLLPSPNGRYSFRIPSGFSTPRPHPSITGASSLLATLFDALTAPDNAFFMNVSRWDA